MIKVNLAKASASVSVETEKVASGGLASFSQSDNLAKIAAMLIFVICLYGYESYNMKEKTTLYNRVRTESDRLAAQVQQHGGVVDAVEDLAKERKTLDKQMKVIQKISKKRAFKLNSIIKLQQSIPEDSWVEEMIVKEDVMSFKGFARSPASVQTIVSGLESLDFMDTAVNKELALKKIGISEVHQFNIEAKVKK